MPQLTRRRPHALVPRAVAMVLIVGGLALSALALVAPQHIEGAYGATKVAIDKAASEVRSTVFHDLPHARLGVAGGRPELDRCDGTFTLMSSYTRDGVPPVWAAHNNCGGDVVLAWKRGDHVAIDTADGGSTEYEVVEVRDIHKTWSSTADLVGLDGDLALQTCFYGQQLMSFVGLAAVAP
ncbi:hypothetical protein M0722_16315 [Microbacterium sp. KSW4-16]|uniref:hypothetical protein n=1 Tax=Microbacterium aurugineum TaxID=2851642 RepID=UPI0020BE0FF8|nr:hypothetical protein [Microbacterium aurugineum]MCK8468759.1 hypothetical protein [Microbacterium aurugineum]